MLKFLSRVLLLMLLGFLLWLAWEIGAPVQLPTAPYNMTLGPNRTLGQLARALEREGLVRNRYVMMELGRLAGIERKLKPGLYRFEKPLSTWDLVDRLLQGKPDLASVTVVEGWTFHQFRQAVDRLDEVQHVSLAMSDEQLLSAIGAPEDFPEGLFFPSTYYFSPGVRDIDLFKHAYRTLQGELNAAWNQRIGGLPYSTPYQLLTMASIIEKETAREQDRPLVAAVFTNRLKLGMRLQTDPSVIYGMGERFAGTIGKDDLRRDTPYNTYTRSGLTPTPIALPGRASLLAAAHPAASQALYFVARGDGSSQFSATLEQHNAAVRKYILKKEK